MVDRCAAVFSQAGFKRVDDVRTDRHTRHVLDAGGNHHVLEARNNSLAVVGGSRWRRPVRYTRCVSASFGSGGREGRERKKKRRREKGLRCFFFLSFISFLTRLCSKMNGLLG